jgi:hypothetical protein
MSLNKRIYISYIILIIALIAFPLIAYAMENLFGYIICLSVSFFTGIANAIAQSTGFGFSAFFPHECTTWISTGTGLSAVILLVARACMLLIFGSKDKLKIA